MASGFICTTCGTGFAHSEAPLAACPICQDERQYVGAGGQRWTTLDELGRGRDNLFRVVERGPEPPGWALIGIGTTPPFAIGQRALLIRTPQGNVLWDCISLLDETTIALVEALGGIAAIAISHPHFYSSMVEWARSFGAPVHLHAADREWVMRPDPALHFWDGNTLDLMNGVTLIRTGGHFPGGTVLHWASGAEGRGALLSGDLLQVVSDPRFVSFMYSYPNLIPLPAKAVERVAAAVEPFRFDRIYGAWWDRVVPSEGKAAVARSAARYVAALEEGFPHNEGATREVL